MSNNGSKQTIVEDGTELKGTLTSTCPIVVRGKVEGEIDTPSLLVSENGAVHGRGKLGALRSQGEISGEFEAETVELAGRVKDNTVIRAKSIEVKLSSEEGKYQVTFGECELSVGDQPLDDAAGKKKSTAPRAKKSADGEEAAVVGSESTS